MRQLTFVATMWGLWAHHDHISITFRPRCDVPLMTAIWGLNYIDITVPFRPSVQSRVTAEKTDRFKIHLDSKENLSDFSETKIFKIVNTWSKWYSTFSSLFWTWTKVMRLFEFSGAFLHFNCFNFTGTSQPVKSASIVIYAKRVNHVKL